MNLTAIEKLLVDLIKIESVSGNEKNIGEFICTVLRGFKIVRQKISKERFNIIASKGKSDLWLIAHMDTVPGVVPLKVTKDKIYGRGAVDNKGNIAGVIIAAQQLENINLLFTIGEEVDFVGAKVNNIKGKVIVMEPTNSRIKLNQCGLIVLQIITIGKQEHSSINFQESDNANHTMVRVLNQLLDYKWNGLNISPIQGGFAPNVVADKCVVNISIRPKTKKDYDKILEKLKHLSQSIFIEIKNSIPPYSSNLSIKKADIEPVSFFSELVFFQSGVLFGAGDIKQAHSKDEYIKRSELRKLPANLLDLVDKLQ